MTNTVTRTSAEAVVTKFNPLAVDAFNEMADEAEHQDGTTYWDQFSTMLECMEDFNLYASEVFPDLDVFTICDGIREQLDPIKGRLSDVINECMVEALAYPDNKRAHRFFPMDAQDFYSPEGRSPAYTVIEVNMMAGRSQEVRKRLIHLLFEKIEIELGISPIDVEITIFESPPCNFGFRGMTGDEAVLDYKIDV